MKTILPNSPRKAIFCFVLMLFLLLRVGTAMSQTYQETPRPNVQISTHIHGFWEWLPHEYSAHPTKKYPLILYIHGYGEIGDGSLAQSPLIIQKGPPEKIETTPTRSFQDKWKDTVYNNQGVGFSYIVISPQYDYIYTGAGDIDAMLEYAFAHYRVDRSRVYITGISYGADVVYSYISNPVYAPKIAAAVPLSPCGAPYDSLTQGAVIANNHIAVWGFQCKYDSFQSCRLQNTISWVNAINRFNPPVRAFYNDTCWSQFTHDIFWNTYEPANRPSVPGGKNVYEWMINNVKLGAGALPVTLKSFDAVLDNNQVRLRWVTSNESNTKNFTIERASADLIFSAIATIPAAGNSSADRFYDWTDLRPFPNLSYYRLVLENADGTKSYFEIKKILNKNILNKILFIAPNPVTTHVSAFINLDSKQKLLISIVDMQGRILQQYRSEYSQGLQQLNCNITSFPAGKYVLKVDGTTLHLTESIIKQ